MVEYEGRYVNRLTPYKEHEFNQIFQSSKGNYVMSGLKVQGWYTGCGFNHWQVRIDFGSAWMETKKLPLTETTYYGPFTALSDGEANERYDLLYADDSGTVIGFGVIEGVEATKGTAVIPDIPEDKIVLAKIHINNNDAWVSEVYYPDVQDGDVIDWRVFGNTVTIPEFFKTVGERYLLYDQQVLFAEANKIVHIYGDYGQNLGQYFYRDPYHDDIPLTDRYIELVVEMRSLYGEGYCRANWIGGSLIIPRGEYAVFQHKRIGRSSALPSDGDLITFYCYGTEQFNSVQVRCVWLNFYAKVT